jgi:hypothetical protein
MVETGYCRKCRRTLLSGNFYNATDLFLDTNGLMSICADCIDDMFNAYLETTKSVELSVHKICAILNVIYLPAAVEAAKKYNETRMSNGRDATKKFFGRYKSKIKIFLKEYTTQADNEIDMTYKADEVGTLQYSVITEDDTPDFEELKAFWNIDSVDDIRFLEREMSNFKKSHKADTYSEITLLKEICFKVLEISKDRKADKSIDAKLKSLSGLMKDLAVRPDMTSTINSGENLDSFGKFIEAIEREEPAQWLEHEGHELYKDVDDIESYFKNYFVRPLKNFVLQSKDFNFDGESGEIGDADEDTDVEEEYNVEPKLSEQ